MGYSITCEGGWSIQFDLENDIYTVTRERRKVTVSSDRTLPRQEPTLSASLVEKNRTLAVPAHVMQVLTNELGAAPSMTRRERLLANRFVVNSAGAKSDDTQTIKGQPGATASTQQFPQQQQQPQPQPETLPSDVLNDVLTLSKINEQPRENAGPLNEPNPASQDTDSEGIIECQSIPWRFLLNSAPEDRSS